MLRVPHLGGSSPAGHPHQLPPSPLTSAHRVFLFVDPELVSPSVCSALLLEIEAAQVQQTPEACMRHVVSHALQAALGDACHASALQRKLKVITTLSSGGPAPPRQCSFPPPVRIPPFPMIENECTLPAENLEKKKPTIFARMGVLSFI